MFDLLTNEQFKRLLEETEKDEKLLNFMEEDPLSRELFKRFLEENTDTDAECYVQELPAFSEMHEAWNGLARDNGIPEMPVAIFEEFLECLGFIVLRTRFGVRVSGRSGNNPEQDGVTLIKEAYRLVRSL